MMKFLFQLFKYLPRPVHVLITVAGLLMTFRVGTLMDKILYGEMSSEDPIVEIGHAADAAQESAPKKEEPKVDEVKEAKKDENIDVKKDEKKDEVTEKSPKDKIKKKVHVPFDPLSLNEKQVEILQTLAHRRKEADNLEAKKALMELSEKKISEKMNELKKIKDSIEKITKDQAEVDQVGLKKLVKIYESMKPASAAQIFNKLDLATLLRIIPQMNQKKASAILGVMEVHVAKVITAQLLNPMEPQVQQVNHATAPPPVHAPPPPTKEPPPPAQTSVPGMPAPSNPAAVPPGMTPVPKK
jgi:flagellar motility protein MotE (MotC chaperone)